MADEQTVDEIVLPEARVINENLMVKKAFSEKDDPVYNIELAFDLEHEDWLLDKLYDVCVQLLGEDVADDEFPGEDWRDKEEGYIILPLIDGNKLKRRREKGGKDGSAYADKIIIRSKTTFNRDGMDAEGGIECYDEAVEEVTPVNRKTLYPGMYGVTVVRPKNYIDSDTQDNAITLYLQAFQKTKDGDPLRTGKNHSSMFEPTGRRKGGGSKGRKRRSEVEDEDTGDSNRPKKRPAKRGDKRRSRRG